MLIDDDPEFPLRQRTDAPMVVLLVDDRQAEREAAAAHLRAAGCTVRTAADGLQALYAVDRERPDLVVLDLELPVVSGFRVLHLLKRPGPGAAPVPVLVRTALSFDEARAAVCDGADDIAPRSLSPTDLVARVRRHLRGRRTAA
jgi:DNA-binding response OmpR family regulator